MWRFCRAFKRVQSPLGLFLALMIIWASACCAPFQGAFAHEAPPVAGEHCHAQGKAHSTPQPEPHQNCQCLHPHKQTPAFDGQDPLGAVQQISGQWQCLDRGFILSQVSLKQPWRQALHTPRPPPASSGLWQRLASPPVFYTSTVLLI